MGWAQESFDFVTNMAYKGIKENQTVSEEYLNLGRQLIRRQIVLGGLRLSYIIE
jgi:hypothetical protein